MKTLFKLFVILVVLACPVSSTDLTYGTVTPTGTLYNQAIRDLKDGTNAVTQDVVSANAYALTYGTQNTIKATAGIIKGFFVNQACSGNYVLADAAAGAAAYPTIISTFTVVNTTIIPYSVPLDIRTSNGIAFNVPFASCTVTVSYR